MSAFELHRLTDSDIPEVAANLHGRNLGRNEQSSSRVTTPTRSVDAFQRDLRWRFVKNPAAESRLGIGHGLRDASGKLVGVLLMFPIPFLIGERRLLGLCGGAFFVEPAFRLQGFLLLRRYFAEPGVDLWFATTCNRSSGALFGKLGGRAVEYSRQEYLVPLRLAPIVQEVLHRRGLGRLATPVGRVVSRIATPFFRPRVESAGFDLLVCRDWDRLADLARRYRDSQVLTAERSSKSLEWKYCGSPAHARNEVLLFRDRRGREGWISLGKSQRGSLGQVRTWTVLDWVAPRDGFNGPGLLRSVAQRFSDRGDMLALHGPARLGDAAVAVGARIRQLPSPTIFIRKSPGVASGSLDRVEVFPTDGDTPVGFGAPESWA